MGGISEQNLCGVWGDSLLKTGSITPTVVLLDRAALERVLLAVKVLNSCLDPKGSVTEEEIRRLRLPSDEGFSNYEIACLAIEREVKHQEAATDKAEKPSKYTSAA